MGASTGRKSPNGGGRRTVSQPIDEGDSRNCSYDNSNNFLSRLKFIFFFSPFREESDGVEVKIIRK